MEVSMFLDFLGVLFNGVFFWVFLRYLEDFLSSSEESVLASEEVPSDEDDEMCCGEGRITFRGLVKSIGGS